MSKRFTIVASSFGVFVLALVGYLSLWPVPVDPQPWNAPAWSGYSGVHASNTRLAGLQMIHFDNDEGPEHVVARDGKLYAAMASGNILRMNFDGSAQEVFAKTSGRVLGFDFDASGNLIAADAFNGLISIGADRSVSILTTTVGSAIDRTRIGYPNSVIVSATGKVYFTDASQRFSPAQWGSTFEASVRDIIEQSATGRVLEYDPISKATRVVASGLSFANGVALSEDQRWLFVNETGKYRVWKIDVSGQAIDLTKPSSQASILLDNLPGYPDNLMRGTEGKIWLGFAKPRNPTVDAMATKPWLRKLSLRLPRALWPVPKTYGHVIAFTEDGKVVADMQDPSGRYPETTSVTETSDRRYIQSLHAKTLGWQAK
jgi:sugar lactone lactonase YvrE